jgi:subtilisin family serine protease
MSTQPNRRGRVALLAGVLTVFSLVGVSAPSPSASAAPEPAAPAGSVTVATPPAPPPEIADGRLLVGLTAEATQDDARAIVRAAGAPGGELIGGQTLVVDAPVAALGAAHVDELRADPRVRYVEPNFRVSATGFTPNDPYFPSLTSLRDAQPGGIRAESAWGTTTGSRDIVVGVMDSGIDMDHPDLIGNLWTNRIGIGFCSYGTHGYNSYAGSCTPEDDNGHGTHVAGILGAVGNNGIGVTGVAPRVSMMGLKMLDGNGDGSITAAIEAIDWAISAKQAGVNIRVLSASWGGGGNSQPLREAIARAGQAGILFVTAAGNASRNIEQNPIYPCAYGLANIICVAATNHNDGLANFSDFGGTHVDLAAPGMDVFSTVPPGLVPGCDPNGYCGFSGTSMSTPMVSGAAVLALTADPSLTLPAVRARVLASVDRLPALEGNVVTGGRLNVCKAVPGCGGTAQRRPTAPRDLSVIAGHGRATLRWSPPASNGNGFTITGYTVTGPNGARNVGLFTTQLTLLGLGDNHNARFYVRARNNIGVSPAAQQLARPLSGGFVVDRSGGFSRVRIAPGPLPSPPTGGVTGSAAPDRARGVALLADGTGGYVVDPAGGLHPFGVGDRPAPPAATGGPRWPGQDRARGVALLPSGKGGFVLDAFGGLFAFGIGDNPRPAAARGGPYWDRWDIARGVAITPSGQGGYVADAYGGIHRFVIGTAPLPAAASAGPYWPGWDIVRGVGLSRGNGGGWVLDAYGVLHPFRTRGHAPAKPTVGPYWPGRDEARGLAI